jgi:hydrogenase expression/formation protein HypE
MTTPDTPTTAAVPAVAPAGWVAEALREHEAATRFEHHGSPQPLPGTVREEMVLERIDRARRARPRVKEERIVMSHGAGGKATQTLIEAVFLEAFRNPLLEPLEDAARLHVNGAKVALTTDSYVVSPLFFPGGDIGDLAVNGTVNDLSMAGAVPLYLSAGFILEEGFPVADAGCGRAGRGAGRHRRHQGRPEGQGRRLLHQHRGRRGHRA